MTSVPTVVGVVSAAVGSAVGALAYRRSVKVDRIAAQANVTSDSRAGTAQVIEGLNDIIAALQGLLDTVQEDRADLRTQLLACIAKGDTLRKKLQALQAEQDD